MSNLSGSSIMPNVDSFPRPHHQSSFQPPPKRKRGPRASVACENCRKRKGKCNGKMPCGSCEKTQVGCIYPTPRVAISRPSRGPKQPQETTEQPAVSQGSPTTFQSRLDTSRQSFSSPSFPGSNGLNQPELLERSLSSRSESTFATEHSGGMRHFKTRDFEDGDDAAGSGSEQNSNSDRRSHFDYDEGATTFRSINRHTKGYEYYGATGVFSFLERLRSQARSHHQLNQQRSPQSIDQVLVPQKDSPNSITTPQSLKDVSIVNYLYDAGDSKWEHGQEETNSDKQKPFQEQHISTPRLKEQLYQPAAELSSIACGGNCRNTTSSTTHWQLEADSRRLYQQTKNIHFERSEDNIVDIERFYVRLYFENLHLIHPILDKHSFLSRCNSEIWQMASQDRLTRSSRTSKLHLSDRFSAVYYTVAALGAIVASEDASSSGTFLPPVKGIQSSNETPATSLDWAKAFFEKAQTGLGDIVQVCSLESAQALFLLSIFCQNALQPHNCYMYSGMAARTALAIGLPNEKSFRSERQLWIASYTWWNIFSHEAEMCCSSGRDTLLKAQHHYQIRLPTLLGASHDDNSIFTTLMVSLAEILNRASDMLYGTSPTQSLAEKSKSAKLLEESLERWRSEMPLVYRIDKVSLKEPDSVSKRKIVLKLRYYNARILLFRPFLEHKTDDDRQAFVEHVYSCLEASRQTIQTLYDMYLHRPYFRTWWYNTTYTLNATIIILYVIFQGFHNSEEKLIGDVEKSMEIFHAMDNVTVARNCARLIEEVLDVARTVVRERHRQKENDTHERDLSVSALHSLAPENAATLSDSPYMSSTSNWTSARNAYAAPVGGVGAGNSLPDFNHEDLFAMLFDQDLLNTMDLDWQNSAGGIPEYGSGGRQMWALRSGEQEDEEMVAEALKLNNPVNEGVLRETPHSSSGFG